MPAVPDESVALVVTSPPYPMIEMWDAIFADQDPMIAAALGRGDGREAYGRMHRILDAAWQEIRRVLVPGGVACINIGDATRSMGESFALYSNHARILSRFVELEFTVLPAIVWRKPTNAPNKFMGSGMLPPGAYVTLEHEWVLILRKGAKRDFPTESSKANRRRSAYFWEERNQWFSDVWFDLRGTDQSLARGGLRERSGAYPFELPFRLIQMFSVQGDTVLDPFAGTGTTLFAALASGRNSVGIERDAELAREIFVSADAALFVARRRLDERLDAHRTFIKSRAEAKGRFGYTNTAYGFPVVTRQEVELVFPVPRSVSRIGADELVVEYDEAVPVDESESWARFFEGANPVPAQRNTTRRRTARSQGDGSDGLATAPPSRE
jgi:DNA modification methylase